MLLKRFAFFIRPGGKIEISRGIGVLIATGLPLAIGHTTQHRQLGLIAAFCAQILLLADVGGLYSTRAKTLVGTSIGVTLALVIGTLVRNSLVLTVIIVFCGLFIAGYLSVYGENGAASGLVIGLVLMLAVTLDGGSIEVATERALIAMATSAWVIITALCLWPFRPNYPLLKVVAKNFQGIAQYLRTLQIVEDRESSYNQVRQLLIQSRDTLTYTRMGRWGRSDLRELLIVLIEDSDRIMTSLISIEEILNLHPLPQLKTVSILLEDVQAQVISITEDIAQLILGKRKVPNCNRLKLLMDAIEQQYQLQRQILETDVDNYKSYLAVDQFRTRLKKLQQQLQFASQTAQALQDRTISSSQKERRNSPGNPLEPLEKVWWEPLVENFSFESPIFRHALRLALGSAIGVLIYTFANIPHGFWIGLTLIIVLKPDFSLTFQRFIYRVIGTILGVAAVSILIRFVHDPFWLKCIALLSIAVALSLVRFQYSLAVFFITLFALLLSQIYRDTSSVNFIEARLLCTIIGATLAFILSFSLWRPKEELLFLQAVVKSIKSVNIYFQEVIGVYLGENVYKPEQLLESRNKTRIANVKMQAALQRLINDPNTPFPTMEPAITLANYIPRLGRSITILLTQLEHYSGSKPHPKVTIFRDQVVQALNELTQSLEENRPIFPLPPFDETIEEILSYLQQSQEKHLAQIVNLQPEETITQQYVGDYNIVSNDLSELVRRLEAIYHTVIRLKATATTTQPETTLSTV